MLGFCLPTLPQSLQLPVLIPLRELIYLLFVQSSLVPKHSSGDNMLRHFIIALTLAAGLAAGLAVALTAAAQTQNQATPAASASPVRNDYSKSESWLCRPGRQDACSID